MAMNDNAFLSSGYNSLQEQLDGIFNGASDEKDEAADTAVAIVTGAAVSEEDEVPFSRVGRMPGSRTIWRRECSWHKDYLSIILGAGSTSLGKCLECSSNSTLLFTRV